MYEDNKLIRTASAITNFKLFLLLCSGLTRRIMSSSKKNKKNNEFVTLSSDEISFGVDDTSFPNAIRITTENKTA